MSRRVSAVLALLITLTLAVGPAPPALAKECGCTKVGEYKAPATKTRVQQEYSPDSEQDPTYRLETAPSGSTQTTLTIRRNTGNSIVKSWTVPNTRINFGYSPDGKRFLVRYGTSTQFDEVILWNLDANASVVSTQIAANSATVFSPHGKYLQITQLLGSNWSSLTVYDAVTGQTSLSTEMIFSAPPGGGGDTYGTVGTGFSSDPDNRSFVLAYRDTNGSTQISVRNLQTRTTVYSTSWLSGATGFWRFSPCGDAFGIVANNQPNLMEVTLRKTATNAPLGTPRTLTVAPITLETTLDWHRLKVTTGSGTTYTNVASNTADTACATAPTLSSLTLNRTSAQGGTQHATATITLTGAATSNMTVALSSSDSSAATVPASTVVSSGSTTKTFAVTTKSVTTPKAVTITASAGGVSRSATLTVNPPPTHPPTMPQVTGLAVSPASVTGGQSATATLTLSSAAPTGGTTVALSSNNAAASMPASVIVPGGSTTAAVTVTTAPVSTDTAVTLTASSGGASASAPLTVRAQEQSTSPEAVITDAACREATLPANDDGSTGRVPLPFSIDFFNVTADGLYVNNNGNVTFGASMSTYTPFRITAATPPIIAPFFADVDTRGSGSGVVTHSTAETPATFNGRPAFCANWVGVGYYNSQTDKLNSFQLLLVDRSDVAPGDFDIVMNYDRILWETGSASGGSGGFGGNSAGAGYSAGTGDPNAFYEFPGTLAPGSFLDSNAATGLSRTSRGTLQRGRHIFEVRNGAAPTGATLRGLVTDHGGNPLVGAPVQVCQAAVCRAFTSTGTDGRYQASGLPAGDYLVTVRPPAGSTLQARSAQAVVGESGVVEVDLQLTGPTPPPENVIVSPSWRNGQGVPSVHWRDVLDLDVEGCEGGSATWELRQEDTTVRSGELTEGPAGTYTGQIPPLHPLTGAARMVIAIDCPDGPDEVTEFDLYIDPSGTVRTPRGTPVPDATVTLYRSDNESGPFTPVPDGSAIMSPTNRANPMLTDGDGRFGWDTVVGYYVVRAERAGCTSMDGSAYVETDVLPVPPEWLDLDLRLDCPGLDPPEEPPADVSPPQVHASVSPDANAAGWHREAVTLVLTATDEGEDASGVASITYALDGAQTGGDTLDGDRVELEVSTEGVTTVTSTTTDVAGNISEPQTMTIRVDLTAPVVACPPTPDTLRVPNHKLVDIATTVEVTDGLSGADGFTLTGVASNEPDNGLGDGDTAGDIRGWVVGTPDTAGKLRAERSGAGSGRVYTISYEARDIAGNTGACTATVTVPHSAGSPPRG